MNIYLFSVLYKIFYFIIFFLFLFFFRHISSNEWWENKPITGVFSIFDRNKNHIFNKIIVKCSDIKITMSHKSKNVCKEMLHNHRTDPAAPHSLFRIILRFFFPLP